MRIDGTPLTVARDGGPSLAPGTRLPLVVEEAEGGRYRITVAGRKLLATGPAGLLPGTAYWVRVEASPDPRALRLRLLEPGAGTGAGELEKFESLHRLVETELSPDEKKAAGNWVAGGDDGKDRQALLFLKRMGGPWDRSAFEAARDLLAGGFHTAERLATAVAQLDLSPETSGALRELADELRQWFYRGGELSGAGIADWGSRVQETLTRIEETVRQELTRQPSLAVLRELLDQVSEALARAAGSGVGEWETLLAGVASGTLGPEELARYWENAGPAIRAAIAARLQGWEGQEAWRSLFALLSGGDPAPGESLWRILEEGVADWAGFSPEDLPLAEEARALSVAGGPRAGESYARAWQRLADLAEAGEPGTRAVPATTDPDRETASRAFRLLSHLAEGREVPAGEPERLHLAGTTGRQLAGTGTVVPRSSPGIPGFSFWVAGDERLRVWLRTQLPSWTTGTDPVPRDVLLQRLSALGPGAGPADWASALAGTGPDSLRSLLFWLEEEAGGNAGRLLLRWLGQEGLARLRGESPLLDRLTALRERAAAAGLATAPAPVDRHAVAEFFAAWEKGLTRSEAEAWLARLGRASLGFLERQAAGREREILAVRPGLGALAEAYRQLNQLAETARNLEWLNLAGRGEEARWFYSELPALFGQEAGTARLKIYYRKGGGRAGGEEKRPLRLALEIRTEKLGQVTALLEVEEGRKARLTFWGENPEACCQLKSREQHLADRLGLWGYRSSIQVERRRKKGPPPVEWGDWAAAGGVDFRM